MQTEDPDSFEVRPAHRRIGTYLIGIFVMGIAASVLVFTMAMQGMGWPPAILGGKPQASTAFSENTAVWLYVSPNSKTYYTSIGGNYDTLLAPWRKYLENVKPKNRELTEITDLRTLQYGVLVLPSAAALSMAERQEILAFRDRGGSVLATWATGTRGPAGEWTGWEFLEKLGAAKFTGEIPKEAEIGHLVLSGESPVSFNQSAGKRIWLGNNAERALRFKGTGIGGRFLNWSRTPDPERIDEGAVLYAEAGPQAGRSVIFGFAESSWEQQPTDIHNLVTDSLSWLKHRPNIVKAAWPNGRKAAHLLEMDTEQSFPNALLLAKMMRDTDYKGAFYVLTSSGLEYPDVLKSLNRDFEVAYHGDIHVSFKGQTPEVQAQRISNMQSQMQSVIPDTGAITGFRAPNEGYDKTTEIALQKAGLRHHLSDTHDADTRLPFFAPIEGTDIVSGLMVLPRTQRDDINLLTSFREAPKLAQAMADDFNLTRDTGALGVFSVHSQNLGEGQLLNTAMPGYLSYLNSQKNAVWLATPSAINAWWRDRERFRLVVRMEGPRTEFDVAVGGKLPVNGASLILMLPRKGVIPNITGVKPNMPMPKITLLDEFRASVVFDTLAPGNYFYQVGF